MRAEIIEGYRGIIVKTVRFPHQRGTVFYACSPCDTETIAEHRASRRAEKIHVVSVLMEHLAEIKDSPRTDCRFFNRADFPIQVVCDPLGRPRLLLRSGEGPAISFSRSGGKVWAALCNDESHIGIDVAGTDEFHGEYPFHRVFHPQELHHALRLADGDMARASALLWSVKEAVVKALGCAFHLVDPLQITVCPSAAEGTGDDAIAEDRGNTFAVGLSGKALVRFPLMTGRSIVVRSLSLGKMWLSIALLNRGPTGHE